MSPVTQPTLKPFLCQYYPTNYTWKPRLFINAGTGTATAESLRGEPELAWGRAERGTNAPRSALSPLTTILGHEPLRRGSRRGNSGGQDMYGAAGPVRHVACPPRRPAAHPHLPRRCCDGEWCCEASGSTEAGCYVCEREMGCETKGKGVPYISVWAEMEREKGTARCVRIGAGDFRRMGMESLMYCKGLVMCWNHYHQLHTLTERALSI